MGSLTGSCRLSGKSAELGPSNPSKVFLRSLRYVPSCSHPLSDLANLLQPFAIPSRSEDLPSTGHLIGLRYVAPHFQVRQATQLVTNLSPNR